MRKLLFIIFIASLIEAKPEKPNSIDLQIINYTFNENFDQAKKLALDQIKQNPNSPKYYYYYVNVKVLEYYQKAAELTPENRDEGRKALNKEIIDYCENVLDKFEDANLSLENKFYRGMIYGYLARISGIDGSWWSAFRSGMKAKGIMEEIIKSDPQFYDVYLMLGMLNYYSDRFSGIVGFIAKVLGFSGNREQGLHQFQLAYEKGNLTFGQTALTLIEVYSNLEDNKYAALNYYENFLKRFPNNKRTLNAYCQDLMTVWDLKKVESIIKNDKQNLVEDYVKVRYYDLLGNSNLAIKYGEDALEDEKSLPRGAGNIRYLVAYNSWLMGDNTKSAKYEAALNEQSKSRFALIKNNDKEARWLHSLSVQIANNVSVNEMENFIRAKPNLVNIKGFEDQFNLLVGAYYFNNNYFDKAEVYFKRSLNSAETRDKYSASRNLIEIYMRQSVDKAKVKTLLDYIDDLDNDRLKYRAKDLENKYNL